MHQTDMEAAIRSQVPVPNNTKEDIELCKILEEYAVEKIRRVYLIIDSMLAIFFTHFYESGTDGVVMAKRLVEKCLDYGKDNKVITRDEMKKLLCP